MLSIVRRAWSRLRLRSQRQAQGERDLDDEVQFHLAEEARLRQERGTSSPDAWASARRDFGNVSLVKEVTREMRGWGWLEQFQQDLRFAGRLLRRSPGFVAVALTTLALGIGATTALFTVVNTVLLRPLPFPDPDRLVMVWERDPRGDARNVVQTQNYLDWRARNASFDAIAALTQLPLNVTTETGDADLVLALRVTSEFFRVLGVAPLIGRPILPEEDVAGAPSTVVLSHRYWQQQYGGDPSVIGQQVSINGNAQEVVGVMPPGFAFPGVRAELFVPIQIDPASAPSEGRDFWTVARLRPGITLEAAQANMTNIAAQTARERPGMNARWGATVVSLEEQVVGEIRVAVLVLFGAVLCVLLIACANVANLQMMRATARAREMTVRLALGAGRWRLVHQLAVESLLLAALGGLLGLTLASVGVPAILAMFPPTFPLPRGDEIGLDRWVLAFTAIVSIGAGLFFGLMPALQAGRTDLTHALHAGGRSVTGSGRRLRSLLVGLEVALAVVLVIGAALLARSLVHLYRVDPGFRSDRVLTMRMWLLPQKYWDERPGARFVDEVLERIRALPGVTAAGSIHFLPLSGSHSGTFYHRTDRPAPEPGEMPGGGVSVISPGYLSAMGISVLAGRDIDERDTLDRPRVALINQTLARQFFPGEDPLGKRLRLGWRNTLGDGPPEFEIVGIVRDVRHEGVHLEAGPTLFLAHAQQPNLRLALVVRTTGDPLAIASAVRHEIRSVDPEQGVSDVQAMTQMVADSMAYPRLQAILLGAFGVLALVMACVGLYGIVSYSVEQRRREVGVRCALGAAPASIFRLVLGEGLRLTTVGLIAGVAVAFGATQYLASLLYEVHPTDPAVFASVAASLVAVAIVACYFPARRATRVDPAVVLRDE